MIPLDLISVNDSMVSQLPDLKNTPENTPGPHCMIISPSRSSSFVESWPSAAHVVMSASQRAQELRKYVPFPAPSITPTTMMPQRCLPPCPRARPPELC